jgi:hypothetical protein
MNFFDHKDIGNHLLQLCPKVVKHPVYTHTHKKDTEILSTFMPRIHFSVHQIWHLYPAFKPSSYNPGLNKFLHIEATSKNLGPQFSSKFHTRGLSTVNSGRDTIMNPYKKIDSYIQAIHKRMVWFQKLTKIYFPPYKGRTYIVGSGNCPSFPCDTSSSLLMLIVGPWGLFPRWCHSMRLSVCSIMRCPDLCLHCSVL